MANDDAGRGTNTPDASQPAVIDVDLRFVPAKALAPDDDDADVAALRRALESVLGRDFERRLGRLEPRMLEWLSDPERAAAFALDPAGALERLGGPVEPELIAALRRAGALLQTPTPPTSVRIRFTGARSEPR